MEAIAIIAYVTCDDTLKMLNIKDDNQCNMNTAEVMTTAIIAAIEYSGNIEKARKALKNKYYIPNMLSKSQLNRRLTKVGQSTWNHVLAALCSHSESKEFIVDSCPISACNIVRASRRKLYPEKKYVGYCAAKKEFYVGVKIHMLTDIKGLPLEVLMLPASQSDIAGLKKMNLILPKNASIYADKAYNDYEFEDRLVHEKQIHLLPIRKKNSTRLGGGFLASIRKRKRRLIETAFSCIEKLLPRSIHAVTQAGFETKVMLFIIAYAVNRTVI